MHPRKILLAAILLFISVAFYWPLIETIDSLARGDWDLAFFNNAVPFITIKEYAQLPLWNPFYCGGVSYVGSPDSTFPSLATLFIFLNNDVVIGTKFSVVAHIFISIYGMLLLAQHFRMGLFSALTAAILFTFNGCITAHIAEGPLDWYSICFLPWVMLFYLKSLEQKTFYIAAGVTLAIMLYDRGGYTFIFTIFFLGLYAILSAIRSRDMTPIARFVTAIIIMTGLTAPKLFPLAMQMSEFPRITPIGGHPQFFNVFGSMFSKVATPVSHNFAEGMGWWEINLYIGILPFSLFLLSLRQKNYVELKIISLILLLFSLGNLGALSPWTLLHHLPVFQILRIPSRSFLVVFFTFALLIGLYLAENERHPRHKILVAAILLFIFFDFLHYTHFLLSHVSRPFHTASLKYEHNRRFEQICMSENAQFRYGAWSNMFEPIWYKKGIINGYFNLPVTRSAKANSAPEYKGEFFLEKSAGKVKLLFWSPNRINFHYELNHTDWLVINQNFNNGWKNTRQFPIANHQGLLAIMLPAGTGTVSLYYLPNSFLAGILVSGLTIFIIFLRIAAKNYAV